MLAQLAEGSDVADGGVTDYARLGSGHDRKIILAFFAACGEKLGNLVLAIQKLLWLVWDIIRNQFVLSKRMANTRRQRSCN